MEETGEYLRNKQDREQVNKKPSYIIDEIRGIS